MNDPVETSELLAFSKTVECRSLSRAAAELGLPRATMSRRIARLEERLGTRLLRRTTRSLAMTDAGEVLYRNARIVLDAVERAEASVRRTDDVIRGELRVSVPPLASPSFQAMLCEFGARHPEVRMHVHFSSRHVDMRRDGYDVAIRAGTALEPGLVARTIARAPLVAVASPAYLAAHGTPRSPRDLKHHRCLMAFAKGELPETHWPVRGGGRIHVEGSFFSNEVWLLREAAVRGLGIAVLAGMIVVDALESGALVPVLEGQITADTHVAVVYPEREFVPPQVRAFIDTVVAWAPGQLGVEKMNAACEEARRRVKTEAAPARPGKKKRLSPAGSRAARAG